MANIQEVKCKDGIKYRALIRLKGCAPQSATFKRITDARKWVQDTESAIRDGRYFKTAEAKRHTVSDMIDKYIKGNLTGKKSAENTEHHLLYWKSQIGVKALSDLTPALIGSVRDNLLTSPYYTTRKDGDKVIKTERVRTGATVNRYMAALGHCITTAVKEWEWMESNPMPNIKKSSETKGRVRFLSDDERERLLTACQRSQNPYLYPVVVLALSTGMRQSEIMNLTWSDIDFDNQRILLNETKNGERRTVHLAGKALEQLQELKKQKVRRIESNLVFPGSQALNRGPASLRTAWIFARERAGVVDFKFHDLRHSAASYLAMNGASLMDIAAVLGHKTLSMVKRYSHLSESHVGGVVASMNKKIFG
jgi:integrase